MSLGFDLRDKPSCKDVREASGIEAVVNMYLPGGKRVGKEWVARNPTRHDAKPGSFKVHLTRGCWSDFAMNGESGGDMIDLVAYLTGKTITEAKDELAARFGVQGAKWSDSLTGNIRQPRDDSEVPKERRRKKRMRLLPLRRQRPPPPRVLFLCGRRLMRTVSRDCIPIAMTALRHRGLMRSAGTFTAKAVCASGQRSWWRTRAAEPSMYIES